MYNPYRCRPIGSDRFYEHLKDTQSSCWYATEMPKEDGFDLYRFAENSHVPWGTNGRVEDLMMEHHPHDIAKRNRHK